MATSRLSTRRVEWRVQVGTSNKPGQGLVIFEASVSYIPDPLAAGGPRTAIPEPVAAVLDAGGYACTPDPTNPAKAGERGAELFTTDSLGEDGGDWTWTARPQLRSVNGIQMADAVPAFSFTVPTGTGSLDLAKVQKVPASPGLGTEAAVALVARAEKAVEDVKGAVLDTVDEAVETALDDAGLMRGVHKFPEDDIAFSITDQSGGRSWLEVSTNGAPTQYAAELAAPTFAPFVSEEIGFVELHPATGYIFAITDSDGQFGAGLTLDGQWVTNPDPEADTTGTPVTTPGHVITRTVVDGISTLYSENVLTGVRRRLTVGPEHAKDPRPDGEGNVLYLSGEGSDWSPRYVPAAGGTSARVFPDRIAAWGDSLTYSNGGFWTSRLSAALNMPVANLGVSGERAEGIAARQGGVRRRLVPKGGSIPASGPVDVSADGVFVRPNQYQAAGTMLGTLAGVHGTLSQTKDGSDVWQFTRTTDGTAVSTNGAVWISDDSNTYHDALNVIWAGRNAFPNDLDGPDGDAAGAAIRAMIGNIASYSKRFVIMTVINGEGEGRGTAGHAAVESFAGWARSNYPGNVLDIRRELIDSGLSLAGITPTAQDRADVAADTVPASLRRDYVHLTDAGYAIVADRLTDFITAKGWVN